LLFGFTSPNDPALWGNAKGEADGSGEDNSTPSTKIREKSDYVSQ
jgi:hypothetical protein